MRQPDQPNFNATKVLFENLRNLFACVALAVAGIAISSFPDLSILGPRWAGRLGLAVVLVSVTLMIWNAISGANELAKGISVRSIRFWALFIPSFVIYAALSISVYGAAAKAQLRQFQQGVAHVSQAEH